MRRGGLRRSGWRDVMWKRVGEVFYFEKKAGGKGRKVWGFESVLGFLSKGRDLQDLINSVNLRTLFPRRF